MNKNELVNLIACRSKLSKSDARKSLDATLGALTEALIADEKVTLVGFGSFVITHKEPRIGVNPRTKQQISIEARRTVKFKPGGDLANLIAQREPR